MSTLLKTSQVLIILLFIYLNSTLLRAQELPKIDDRAKTYYSEQEISHMSAEKILQVNYLYSESFIIPEEMSGLVRPEDVNIHYYNKRRDLENRVKVFILIPGSSEKEAISENYILLKSITELQKAYNEIKSTMTP